jgi:UDP-N-acetylmuramoylalanine--D-glutamate ligase
LLPGTATPLIEKSFKLYASKVNCNKVSSMDKAVKLAYKSAEPGDAVLLSPGCASFGLFKNEFDRGDQFNEAVKKLNR